MECLQPGTAQCKYTPELRIYEQFAALNGVEKMIALVSRNIEDASWQQYIEEVYSFSCIPQFFSFYIKNKQSMQLLFSLLSGKGDNYSDAVRFIYNTLLEVFKKNASNQIRLIAVQKNLIHKLLDRIALISKEQKRTWSDTLADDTAQLTLAKKQSEEVKKPSKKQGTGYGSDYTGQNQKWNTQEYIEKKQEQGQQLVILLNILEYFFDDWQLDQDASNEVIRILLSSCLLPLLESAFRSGSLLEMNKEHHLYIAYLHLVKVFARNNHLATLLLPIPQNYLPR